MAFLNIPIYIIFCHCLIGFVATNDLPLQTTAIISDPSNGYGVVYAAEGSNIQLLWQYYVPLIGELSEISLAHNEHHVVRYFRIRSTSLEVTNITAIFPPFPSNAFVNDVENMTVGFKLQSVNRTLAGNWTLSIVYSNFAMPAARSSVVLYIAAAPTNIRVHTTYVYPMIRSHLEIQCLASSNSVIPKYGRPLSFRWFHNGMEINADLFSPPLLADNTSWISKLAIPSVSEVIGGNYACQAEELGLSTISSTVRITVVGFPVFVQRPSPAITGTSLSLNCQPQLPRGIGMECSSISVRVTCNGRQLHALTFPLAPSFNNSLRLRVPSSRDLIDVTENFTSVDYTFDSVVPELNAVDCLCIVKYYRRKVKVGQNRSVAAVQTGAASTDTALTAANGTAELTSSLRLNVFYPPSDIQIIPEPPFPWLVQVVSEAIALNKSVSRVSEQLFRLKCAVSTMGNPKEMSFSWPSEQLPLITVSQPTAWSSLLDLTKTLQPSIDNSRVVQCLPSNAAGSGPLTQIRLVVYSVPVVSVVVLPSGQLVESSQQVDVREGSSLSLRCLVAVSGATPQPGQFLWRRDGVLLSANSPDLSIPTVNAIHAGRYQCEVVVDTNSPSLGVITSAISFRLAVIYMNLTIEAMKSSEVVGEGDNVTLVCRVNGHPINEITFEPWLFEPTYSVDGDKVSFSRDLAGRIRNAKKIPDNENLAIADSFREGSYADRLPIILPENTLSLVNVQPSDSGKYWCSATNEILLTRRRVYSLNVQFKPVLVAASSSPPVLVIHVGRPILLVATVHASPLPDETEWLRLAGILERPEVIPDIWNVERFSAIASQLHIPALSPVDLQDGPVVVAVRVKNSRGQSMFPFKLVVRGPPSDPSDLMMLRSLPYSLVLAFRAGFHGGSPQIFNVECRAYGRRDGTSDRQNVIVQDPGFNRLVRVVISSLQPSTLYNCSVEGISYRFQNNSTQDFPVDFPDLTATNNVWRTQKLFVSSKTKAYPLINVTEVDWAASILTNGSSISKERLKQVYSLRQVCLTVSCLSHSSECHSKTSFDSKSTFRSTDSNIAGMQVVGQVMICSSKMSKQLASLQTNQFYQTEGCWKSLANHTVEVFEQQRSLAETVNQTLHNTFCFSRDMNTSGSLPVVERLPIIEFPLVINVRLYSADGDVVATLLNAPVATPRLRYKSTNRFYPESDDYAVDASVDSDVPFSGADGLLWPVIGIVLAVVLVLGFFGIVALIVCSSARRAKLNDSSCRRISLSTSVSTVPSNRTTGIFASSASPSSGERSRNAAISTYGSRGKERLNMITFSSGNSHQSSDAASDNADFHWADFRANPHLSVIGVASTIASPPPHHPLGSVRSRREERMITCISGMEKAKIFCDNISTVDSIRKMIKQQAVESGSTGRSSEGSDCRNSVDSYHCINGFELQQEQRQRMTSLFNEAESYFDEEQHDQHTTPPPRYATLYSRLADLKIPVTAGQHSNVSSVPTQYARLDFVKMANLSSQAIPDKFDGGFPSGKAN